MHVQYTHKTLRKHDNCTSIKVKNETIHDFRLISEHSFRVECHLRSKRRYHLFLAIETGYQLGACISLRAMDFCIYTTKLGLIVDQFQLLTNDVLLWINAHFVFLKVSSIYYYRPKQTSLVKYRLLCFPDRKIEG